MAKIKLKLLYLIDIFHKKTDCANRLSAEELCHELLLQHELKVERKAIYRDIDTLCEYGFDIVLTPTGYYLGNRKFSQAEIRLLTAALQAATFIPNEQTTPLINRLCCYLSQSQEAEVIGQANLCVAKCPNTEFFHNIDSANRAIYTRHKLSFYYYRRDESSNFVRQNNHARYVVSPYALILIQDKYYLVANTDDNDDLTHFRLDSIRGAYVENVAWRHFSKVSPYTLKFDAEDYSRRCLNLLGGSGQFVTLRCQYEVVNEVLERFGDGVVTKRLNDSLFSAIVKVVPNSNFYAWVGQFFGKVEIASPMDIRVAFCDLLRAQNKLYFK